MIKLNKNIIWLASYPKSGNTWVRIFLANMLGVNRNPADRFHLDDIPIASNRFLIDQYLGVPSSDLSSDEIYEIRPEVYKEISKKSTDLKIIKVHDSFGFNSQDIPIFPPEITAAAVYIVRNPLDVAVSYAFHSNISMDESIRRINDKAYTISENVGSLKAQVSQHIGSWSDHVYGWVNQNHLKIHVIKFEDLLNDTENTFISLLKVLKITWENSNFERALINSDFKKLQSIERMEGFKEKPLKAKSFFREGKAGGHAKYLSDNQVQSVIDHHHDLMKQFGYLNRIE